VWSILIFFHLCLGLPSSLFTSGFPTKLLDACFFCHIHARCTVHLTLLNHPKIFGEAYKSWSFSSHMFLQYHVTTSCKIKTLSVVPCSQMSWIYVLCLVRETSSIAFVQPSSQTYGFVYLNDTRYSHTCNITILNCTSTPINGERYQATDSTVPSEMTFYTMG
jgi:hypothetical protein